MLTHTVQPVLSKRLRDNQKLQRWPLRQVLLYIYCAT